MPAFSGKNARVQVDGVNLIATKWTVNFKTDELDITTFESGGFADWTYGIHEADLSVEAFWNSAASPIADPPGIVIGAVVAVTLFLDSTGAYTASSFSFPSTLITSVSVDTAVRDLLRFNFMGKAKGSFSAASNAAI